MSDRLIKEVPAVLHFSARGTPDGGGLRFLTGDGADAPVRDRGLSDLLGQFVAEGLRLVVLGACWTSELAELLAVAVPCVIGTAGPIGDQDCRTYSRTLYSSLAHGRSVGQSHAIARATADASGADPDYLPSLRGSPGTIPEAVYLIGPEFRVPCGPDPGQTTWWGARLVAVRQKAAPVTSLTPAVPVGNTSLWPTAPYCLRITPLRASRR